MDYLISTDENNIGKLTIVDENDNSFLLCEEETPFSYSTVTIGNQTWTSVSIDYNVESDYQYSTDIQIVNDVNLAPITFYKINALETLEHIHDEYRLPTIDDIEELKSFVNNNSISLKSTFGWNTNQGTNIYGFNAKPHGCFARIGSTISWLNVGSSYLFWLKNSKICNISDNNTISYSNADTLWMYNVRLIKNR